MYYQVSCNYGPTTSTGQQAINDGKWHTIKWTRSNFNATLFIDDVLVGNSGIMNECELNLDSPFYLGGTDPAEYGRIIASIVRTNKLFGYKLTCFYILLHYKQHI